MTNVLSRCRNVLSSITIVILNIGCICSYHLHHLCSKSLDFSDPGQLTVPTVPKVDSCLIVKSSLCQQLRDNNFIHMDCNIHAQRFSQAEWKSCENEEFPSTVYFQELACILPSRFQCSLGWCNYEPTYRLANFCPSTDRE